MVNYGHVTIPLRLETCFEPGNCVDVDMVKFHPHYQSLASDEYDIALLRLKTPLQWTERVKPVCLPSEPLAVNEEAIILGWGKTQEGMFP